MNKYTNLIGLRAVAFLFLSVQAGPECTCTGVLLFFAEAAIFALRILSEQVFRSTLHEFSEPKKSNRGF